MVLNCLKNGFECSYPEEKNTKVMQKDQHLAE